MVSVCLPSDALLRHLPSYLGFSYLGRGVSLHGCSSKAQPLLLTLDEGYLLTATLPDLQHGMAPLGPPAPAQPLLLGRGLLFPAAAPALDVGWLLQTIAPDLRHGVAPLGHAECAGHCSLIQKRYPFHYRGLECKSRKSRNTWSNRHIWPWNAE